MIQSATFSTIGSLLKRSLERDKASEWIQSATFSTIGSLLKRSLQRDKSSFQLDLQYVHS